MAFPIEAPIALCLMTVLAHGAGIRVEARHDHWHRYCAGSLEVGEEGIHFTGPKHRWQWRWTDVQQVLLSHGELRVTTYRDSQWRLGADQELRFELPKDVDLAPVGLLLNTGLDRHYVDAWSRPVQLEWTLAAKHLERFGGKMGKLAASQAGLTFQSEKNGGTRCWRWRDIERISSSNPYELTLTTFERSRVHYGGRRDFTFQLREPLSEQRYQEIWSHVERIHNTTVLDEFVK